MYKLIFYFLFLFLLSSCAGSGFLKQRYTKFGHFRRHEVVATTHLLKQIEVKVNKQNVLSSINSDSLENTRILLGQKQAEDNLSVNEKKLVQNISLKTVKKRILKKKRQEIAWVTEDRIPPKGVDVFLNVLYFLVCLALFVSIIVFLFINPWVSLIIWASSWAILGIIASIAWLVEKHKEKHPKKVNQSS